MKSRLLCCLLIFLLLLSLSLIGCENSNKEIYTVTVEFNSNRTNETINVKAGGIVGDIYPGYNIGYTFKGWFTDTSYTYQWNTAKDTVIGDITLYAKWEKNEINTNGLPAIEIK